MSQLVPADYSGIHGDFEWLPNKVTAAEYQTVLPDEGLLARKLERMPRELEARRIGRTALMEHDK